MMCGSVVLKDTCGHCQHVEVHTSLWLCKQTPSLHCLGVLPLQLTIFADTIVCCCCFMCAAAAVGYVCR